LYNLIQTSTIALAFAIAFENSRIDHVEQAATFVAYFRVYCVISKQSGLGGLTPTRTLRSISAIVCAIAAFQLVLGRVERNTF
jgi:hypothetical protein